MKYTLLLTLALLAACNGRGPTAPTPVPPPVVVTPPVAVPPGTNPLLSDPRFDLAFYHQLTTRPLYRWNQAPRIYLRTIDDGGRQIDVRLLDQTAAAIINTTGAWTGGAFGVAGLERGTETRQGQAGWITVAWTTVGICGGTTLTGVTSSQEITSQQIVMNHARSECTCGPLVAKHELGHAMGYSHTDSDGDLMAATFQGVCDKDLSARERFHAQVAYTHAAGSMEP